MTYFNKNYFIGATISLILGQACMAADNELYDSPPPDDAVFIRWMSDHTFPPAFGISSPDISPHVYYPVSASTTQGAIAGTFYTVSENTSGETIIITEPPRADRSKVHMILLNFTDADLRLVVADNNIEVIAATGKNSAQSRAVNPVKAVLDVQNAKGDTLHRFDIALRRGQNITFVAHGGTITLIENNFGATIGPNNREE